MRESAPRRVYTPSFNHEQIRGLREQGLTYDAIAERVGCSAPLVGLIVNGRVGARSSYHFYDKTELVHALAHQRAQLRRRREHIREAKRLLAKYRTVIDRHQLHIEGNHAAIRAIKVEMRRRGMEIPEREEGKEEQG